MARQAATPAISHQGERRGASSRERKFLQWGQSSASSQIGRRQYGQGTVSGSSPSSTSATSGASRSSTSGSAPASSSSSSMSEYVSRYGIVGTSLSYPSYTGARSLNTPGQADESCES